MDAVAGTIKFYNGHLHYGIITDDVTGENVFFHLNDFARVESNGTAAVLVPKKGRKGIVPQVGQRVMFIFGCNKKGPKATRWALHSHYEACLERMAARPANRYADQMAY